jgi:hypothetical protein
MFGFRSKNILAIGVVAALAGACADTTGIGDTGSVRVTLQQAGTVLAPAASPAWVNLSGADMEGLDRALIASLEVTVTSIAFLPVDEDDPDDPSGMGMGDGDMDGTSWISLPLGEPVPLDLLALPSEMDSPIVIAAGDVPVGDYRKVRLFVENATISFTEAITKGNATFDAEVDHPVDIPSAANSGLKTDAIFSVVADDVGAVSDVNLLFDPTATFKNVTVTGSGRVILAPVIKAHMN